MEELKTIIWSIADHHIRLLFTNLHEVAVQPADLQVVDLQTGEKLLTRLQLEQGGVP